MKLARPPRPNLSRSILTRFTLGAAGLALCGCADTPRPARADAPTPPAASAQAPAAPTPATITVLDHLEPYASAPGVVVCEPVAQGTSPSVSRLGIGCARWLHLQVGGQGAFGKTPLLAEMTTVLDRLGAPRAGQDKARLQALDKHLAVTHAVLTEISGSEAHCKLVVRPVTVAGKPVGAPIVLTGTTAAVVRKLPQTARELCRRLGAAQPAIDALDESPADLQFLGSLSWSPQGEVGRPQVLRLETLAERSLLASLLAVQRISSVRDNWQETDIDYRSDVWNAAMRLGKQAGTNVLALDAAVSGIRAAHYPGDSGPLFKEHQAALARFPHNYALQQVQSALDTYRGDEPAALRAAEEAVRCNPRSQWAWSALGAVIGEWANVRRQARNDEQITPRQWQVLLALYREELKVRKRAVEIDPSSPDTWLRLASTEGFSVFRDGPAAEIQEVLRSTYRAVELDPLNPYSLRRAMEFYQLKWFDEKEKLEKTKKWVRTARFRSRADRWYLANYFLQTGWPEEVDPVLKDPQERAAFHREQDEKNGKGTLETDEERRLTVVAAGPPRLFTHNASVRSVVWSPDGTRLVSAGNDRIVKVWTPGEKEWAVVNVASPNGPVPKVSWSPDSTKVVSASEDGVARISAASASARPLLTLTGHTGMIWSVAWSPDGRTIATGGEDKTARLWDAQTGRLLHTLDGGGVSVPYLAFMPKGDVLAIAGFNPRTISLWDVATGKRLRQIPQPAGIMTALTLSPDGRLLATGDDAGMLRIWDVRTGKEYRAPSTAGKKVISIAWSPDGRYIAAGSTDRGIYVWTAAEGQLQRKLRGHQGEPLTLSWNPKHPWLASGGGEGDVRAWSMEALPADAGGEPSRGHPPGGDPLPQATCSRR